MADIAITSLKQNFMVVTFDGAGADWNIAKDLAGFVSSGLRVKSIHFHPTAANDILRIREGSATGPDLMFVKCTADTDQRVKYFGDKGKQMWPYIVMTEQAFGDKTAVKIIFELA